MPVLARCVVDRRLDGVLSRFVVRQKTDPLEFAMRLDEVGLYVAALLVSQ